MSLLPLQGLGHARPVLIDSVYGTPSSGSSTTTSTGAALDIRAGDLVVVSFAHEDTGLTDAVATDSLGNRYPLIASRVGSSAPTTVYLYIMAGVAKFGGLAATVTVTTGAARVWRSVSAYVFRAPSGYEWQVAGIGWQVGASIASLAPPYNLPTDYAGGAAVAICGAYSSSSWTNPTGWTRLGSGSASKAHFYLLPLYPGTSGRTRFVYGDSGSNFRGCLIVVFGLKLAEGFLKAGGVGATVNRAAETDTAQAIARSKSKAIGQAAESDFAQAAARYKARVAALAAETDTAQAVGKSKARTAGQAAESDTSRTITPAGAPVGGTVTQAIETDAARALSGSKAKAIGQAAELDLAQTILRVKARAVGQALEGDSARPISLPGSIGGTLAQAIESDLARNVGKAKAKAIAQALETDAGRAVAALRAYAVGRASETDTAIAVAAIGKALALGVATEHDIARAFTVSGGAPVDFYYLREALEMAAASIIAALANTTVTVDVGGAGETSGVVAIQQERSFDPGLPGLRMASTSTEFLLEKKTAPASLKQGTLIRDETSSETYRVRRLNYNRGGIVTVEIERV